MPLDIPDQTIATKIQTPDMFRTIGNILSIRQGQQALQQGAVNLEQSQRTLEPNVASSQAAAELARTNADTARIKQPSEITSAQEAAKQAQIKTNLDQYRLTGAEAEIGRNATTSLLQDPDVVAGNPDGIIAKLQQQKQAMIDQGLPPVKAEAQYVHAAQVALSNPKGFRQFLANTVNVGLGASGQAQQNLVSAGGQQAVGPNDFRGNPSLVQRDQFGNIQQGTLPLAEPPPTQGRPGPLIIPPGESADTYKLLSGERDQARTIRMDAPNAHGLTREILAELPKATTGQYSGLVAKGESIAGMLGVTLNGKNEAERAASAYDLIDKYSTQLALNAAQKMGAAGAGTATGIEANIKANASTERNPTALAKALKRNDAIVSGAEAYQEGLEKAISANPQMDVFAKRKYDQAWAQNFDPLAFQIYNAQKSGDKAELADLIKSAGDRLPAIVQKARNLQALSSKGAF